ncbi:sensor histidine kinase [filamentous cyanobacterium CCP5]|nr:sensor histidine kinase [filamentous cyanobacterium CCP5]
MIVPTSPEFLALCQSQMLVLSQALGVTSTAVYLADHRVEPDETGQSSPALIPVYAYPERSNLRSEADQRYLPEDAPPDSAQIGPAAITPGADGAVITSPFEGKSGPNHSLGLDGEPSGQRLVLPMAYDEVLLGVLVCSRPRPWAENDQRQAEQVASSLAIACVLDQRGQWMQRQLQQTYLDQQHQSEHFHDLLHQFRNPLTAMGTFGRLMLRRLEPEDKNYSAAEGIVRESDRLQDLTRQFDAAVADGDLRLERSPTQPSTAALALPSADNSQESTRPGRSGEGLMGQLSLEALPVDDILKPLLASAGAVAQERQILMGQGLVEHLPPVWMDSGALREVLSNLLDNALKYSPAGAWVWVATGLLKQVENQEYQGIAVGDTGPGIPAADQGRVFERSYRGVQAEGTIAGTGLGLAIAQDLIAAMGGSIELYSPAALSGLVPAATETTGPGSVFILWLRQAEAQESA